MFSKEQIEMLNENMPAHSVEEKESSDGKMLAYITTHYAYSRASEIFGAGNWSRITTCIDHVDEFEFTSKKGKKLWKVSHSAEVRVEVITENGIIVRTGVDCCTMQMPDKAQCREFSMKGAVTLATKRALMTFGNSLGLALREPGLPHVDGYGKKQAKTYHNADGTVDDSWDDLKEQLKMLCNLYYMTTKECGYEFALGQYGKYAKKSIDSYARENKDGKDRFDWFTKGVAKLEEWHAGQKENGDFIDETMKVDDNVLNM